MMPVKNGFEVCEDLKTNWLTSHIPIILLTAKSAIEHKIAGLRTGADDYLSKPFYTEELLARIENLLNARKLLKEKYSAGSEVLNKGEKHWLGLDFSAQEREFLRKIDQLLVEHLDQEAFSVEDLAEPLFVSRVQLYRKLKAITGQSPSDYIRNFRLEEARRLLESGQCNVNEAVLQTGFASRQYFTKAFKAKFGYPPGELSKGQ
jgi:AraC-like DNA-binding protein